MVSKEQLLNCRIFQELQTFKNKIPGLTLSLILVIINKF